VDPAREVPAALWTLTVLVDGFGRCPGAGKTPELASSAAPAGSPLSRWYT